MIARQIAPSREACGGLCLAPLMPLFQKRPRGLFALKGRAVES